QGVRRSHVTCRAARTRRNLLDFLAARMAPPRRHRTLSLDSAARRAAESRCIVKGMIRVLLMLWMALIGADRLDLAGGSLPVVVTPFLALTPVVLGALAWERWRSARPAELHRGTIVYFLLVALFLAAVGGSALQSLDPNTTISRAELLLVQLGGGAAVALMVHDDTAAIRAVRQGAALGVLLFVVMDFLAVLAFLGNLPTM